MRCEKGMRRRVTNRRGGSLKGRTTENIRKGEIMSGV